MPSPDDFIARRWAAIQAEREQRAGWEAQGELSELAVLAYELEERMRRERLQRQKYWEAMVRKRASHKIP